MTSSRTTSQVDTEQLARKCVEICQERKAVNIKLYDVHQTSMLADFFVVCSGTSAPHIRAICNHLRKELNESGLERHHVEGIPASRWMIMDYGTVLIHVFHPEARRHYCLEELWDEDALIYSSTDDGADPQN